MPGRYRYWVLEKELSYQSSADIRLKADFFLVYDRYNHDIDVGISQVYT